MKRKSDALAILTKQMGRSRSFQRAVKQARASAEMAVAIHDAREAAGLSQTQLARLVGTTQSVISRLEDAAYEGHSLTMLYRIACALRRPLYVGFGGVPKIIRIGQKNGGGT